MYGCFEALYVKYATNAAKAPVTNVGFSFT